jgi:hypothetical protein
MPSLPASKPRSISGGSQKKARRVSLTIPAPTPEVDEQAIEAMTKIFNGQKLSGHKPRGGQPSPIFDYPTKLPGKKRISPQEYALSGKRGYLRAPTAPPSAGGPWRAPPQY